MKIVLILLQEDLKFLHEEPTDKLVLPLLKEIQSVQINQPCDLSNDRRVDTAHVYLELRHLFYVVYKEANALIYEQIYLQEVCGYQNRNDVLLV